MNKIILFFCFLLMVAGCGEKNLPRVPQTNVYPRGDFELARLRDWRVQELLVVIFDRDFSPQEWKLIFEKTKKMSENKQELRSIAGRIDPEAAEVRSLRMAENADLLTELSMKSLFLLSWTWADESCRFEGSEEIHLACRPKNLENPLNGGLPRPTEPLRWIDPHPVVSEIKIPYLSLRLEKKEAPYSLELRLKPEWIEADEMVLKGESIPSPTSRFVDFEGIERSPSYPYGYAEMTLAP